MKITRLEIVGFKSFVDKVVLTFPEGITSIVGPNGCGKSNVVDALRWVMGEQSAKNLRGASMDDVIFVGSDSRKPVGMAEVSIVFSTDDGQVPAKYLNFHEIQVTRRLYRDGDSEYLINKTPCRLLDITELFMDTGVGTKAYSVIEQGKIGMILHSKPEERRFIIEEAAGISKYKARKKVALRKMEVTRQNLLRLSDIISEIRRQMAGVQRQAKKAESFKLYREELKEIELAAAFHEYLSLREEQQRLGAELDRLRIDEERLASQVAQGELTIERSRLQLLEEEQAVATTQELLFQQRGEVASFESRLEFRRKELANLQRLLERLGVESEEGERRRGEAEEEIERLEMEAQRLIQELSDSEERLAQGEERLSLLASAEIAKSQQLEEQRRQLFGVMSEVAASSNQHAAALKKISALDERFERGRRESIAIGERLAESSSKSMQQDASMELLRQQRRDQDADINRFTQRVEEARHLLAGLEKELLSRRDELGRSDSRLHSLREMTSQYAGTGEGVRSVLRAPRFHERFPGLVADLLQTSPELEGVLETLLAERLSFIVAKRHEDAAEAIDFLVENRGGRGTFIVSDAPHPVASPPPVGTLPLLDAVTVDKSYYPLLALLLANCFLAEDLSTAHQLSLKYPAATFVTRRGEVVAPGGIVSGGAGEDGGEGEIHLRREIRELAERVAFLSGELQQLEEQLTSAKDLLAQGEEEVRSARQRLHESDLAIVNAEKDLQRHRDEERHLAERQEVRTLEDEQLQEERESLLREAEAAVTRQQELLASREGTEKSVSDAEEGLEAIRHELDQAREEVTVAKVRAASLGQKRDENGRLLARTRALIDELLSRQGKSGSDLAAATAERDLLQQQLEGSDDELRRLMRQFSDTEVEFARVKARHDGVAEQLREGELTLRRGRAEHEALRSALAERNITFTSLSLELQHLSATVSDRHRVDISVLTRAHVPPDFDAEAQKRRRQELERLITDLGEVNLLALEQYAELETRHDFLVAQQNDLQESLQGLQQAINRINRTTRRRFQETFALVNERFRQVFPRLFCGGFAELRLTDEDDLLETGIDIIAQPPGKKLQNITALSGGEKALTAVALIFSIFLIKPSPFCLLDEVDAPLDDANIGRFNDMVREMSVTSQFIIITHNKTTMAIADTLYGVTMEEPGVSKLVSVRLAQEQLQKTGEQRAI